MRLHDIDLIWKLNELGPKIQFADSKYLVGLISLEYAIQLWITLKNMTEFCLQKILKSSSTEKHEIIGQKPYVFDRFPVAFCCSFLYSALFLKFL